MSGGGVCEFGSGASEALVKSMVFKEKRLRNNITTLRSFRALIAPYEHEIFTQRDVASILYSVSFTACFS
jgi:hypothetical protein